MKPLIDKQKIAMRYHRNLYGSEPDKMMYFTMQDVFDCMDEYKNQELINILNWLDTTYDCFTTVEQDNDTILKKYYKICGQQQ
jgi:hypothetical protein